MWVENQIRQVAGQQHGVLTRGDLSALGASRHEIDHQIRRGRLTMVQPGVYNIDSVPASWKTSVLEALYAAGPKAAASHRTAAVLWGFDAISGLLIELTVPYLKSPEPAGALIHRTRRKLWITEIDAIPITRPERTLLDLAPILPARVLFKVARSGIHKGLTSIDRLDKVVGTDGGRGVAGTRRMRWLIGELADDVSASVSEIDLQQIISEIPIPRPVQQLRIKRPSGRNAYPDFAWPDLMKIIEVDGFEAHGTPEQLQEDLQRQNDLMDLGWSIRRFTATEVRDDPERVRDEIARFIGNP